MPVSFRTDILSMYNVRSLGTAVRTLYASMAKLSSGLAINVAADNPAGLVISEQFRARIASLNRQIENVSNTINKYRAVSGTVDSMRSRLVELRSLAVGAANEAGNSDEAQQAYSQAAEHIIESYNDTVASAEYNGMRVLDGSEGSLAAVAPLEGIDLSTPLNSAESLEKIDAAMRELDRVQIDLGATQKNDLESQLSSLLVRRESLTAAESQIRDLDYATEYSNFVGSMIRSQVNLALMSHTAGIANGLLRLMAGT